MIEAALAAFFMVLEPTHLMFLCLGVFVGLAVGFLPGLGGIVGMALLLPVAFQLDPQTGIAMLIGVAAVITTSDTFPSVLMGIPGSAGSQATIIDGYAMAQKGQAARALSAAFIASMFGGVIGALALTLSLPIARPLVLSFATPELLMMSILGLCMIGVLSGDAPLKGLLVAGLGLLVGTIGAAEVAPAYRYDMGYDYLFDGLPLVVVSLGLFALPEFVDLLARGGAIAKRGAALGGGWLEGARDIVRHWWLVLRHSLMGVGVGMVPGLGSAIVDWMNYGYLVQTAKHRGELGRGDVRGVIAPESANNAKEGGALIPTLLFGVPGSAGMALLLSAFVVFGIQPGPRMLDTNLSLVFVIIWSLALANILGTIACLVFIRPIARLTTIPFSTMFPVIFLLVTVGAFQATRHVGDLIVLAAFGLLGWLMKRHGFPRAPLLIGFILSPLVERNLWITTQRYGLEWLERPGVITIGLLTVILVVVGSRRRKPIVRHEEFPETTETTEAPAEAGKERSHG
ncbi:tripartite tricarboxylate transporter permease [Salinarimonas rosea]|uniref:tripartite tricarboxylate transporter permease n=1 Tax=Salinarimonas rosea TaxID=552063 RepID=UPI0003FB1B7E|nr:tripartite tricarboxylate transporter permease [Salinarimonas rosea]